MKAKSIVLIAIALGCGLVASIGISQVIDQKGNQQPATEQVKILVASTDIDIADSFNGQNVRVEDWPKDKVPEHAVLEFHELEGKFARARLYPGEIIMGNKVMDSSHSVGDSIPDGYRVVSAKVSMETGVSNLLRPGDRVDVIAFLRQSRDIPETQAKPVLTAVRIFAINSQTTRDVEKDGVVTKTVSFLIKKEQVGRTMLALELGTLRLALRGTGDALDEDAVALDEARIADLLDSKRRKDLLADDEDNQPSGPANSGLLEFLEQSAQQSTQVAMKAPVVEPFWRIKVLTPEGYQWYEMETADSEPVPVANTAPGAAAPEADDDDSTEAAVEVEAEEATEVVAESTEEEAPIDEG